MLSAGGSFSSLRRNADSTVYWAECRGSGKNPYQTSVDISNEQSQPVCRCSCPSRQHPCKHGIGLLFEIAAGRKFEEAELPEDIAEKKARKQASDAKKAARAEAIASGTAQPRKTNAAAKKKKLEKQLEGIARAEKMADELLSAGIATLSGSSASSYRRLATELGNYYLTGPQTTFERIAAAVEKIQEDKEKADLYYAAAVRELIYLHAVLKKSRDFLSGKLEADNFSQKDSVLYEALGGVWTLESLYSIQSLRRNARLIQLSFDVGRDEAKQEQVERGFFLDLDTGEIAQTRNLRPLGKLKTVRAADSVFGVVEVPVLYVYPGDANRRIRWDGFTVRDATPAEYAGLPSFARDGIPAAVKKVKALIKNTLMPKFLPALLPVGRLGTVSAAGVQSLVLEDPDGSRIVLRDRYEDGADHATTARLRQLPVPAGRGQALFGLIFYDETDRTLCMHPYSLLTGSAIIRLHY